MEDSTGIQKSCFLSSGCRLAGWVEQLPVKYLAFQDTLIGPRLFHRGEILASLIFDQHRYYEAAVVAIHDDSTDLDV